MKKLLIIVGSILVVLIGLYFAAGYFLGNLPVASRLLGTNKPKNLGVQLSAQSASQGLEALRKPVTIAQLEAIYRNTDSYKKATGSLTEAQASSLISLGDIPNFPFRTVQLTFGPNGQVQSSGVIDIKKLQTLLNDFGANSEVTNRVMGIVKNASYVNYYVEATCSITNNRLDVDVSKLQIGKIGLPTSFVDDNKQAISSYVEKTLRESGYNIRSMKISEDKVTFDMDRPIASLHPWLKFVATK
jgi:hypothetical protein